MSQAIVVNSRIVNVLRAAAVAGGLALLIPPAGANDLFDAKIAMGAGDFTKALKILEPLAGEGIAEAQFLIGLMHSTGEGVPKNAQEAVKWYRLAAERGSADAQYALGQEYSLNEPVDGVDQLHEDYAESYFWFSVAAENYIKQGRGNIAGSKEMRDMIDPKLSDDERAAVDTRVKAWINSNE